MNRPDRSRRWLVLLTLLVAATPLGALPRTPSQLDQASILPEQLQGVGFSQLLGQEVPLDLSFTDSSGATVQLADFAGERPVLLAPVYFECPMLCSLVLDGVVRGLKPLGFDPGEEFEVVVVSFDPRETPELSSEAKREALQRYDREEADGGWHFLTGETASIEPLMSAIGFDYTYDEASGQYAHAGGIVLLTPEGTISRYFLGVDYPPKDLRLGLVEASRNEIGSLVDQVFLYCFNYDPSTGKYTAAVLNIIKLGGALTLLALATFLTVNFRRDRAEARMAAS